MKNPLVLSRSIRFTLSAIIGLFLVPTPIAIPCLICEGAGFYTPFEFLKTAILFQGPSVNKLTGIIVAIIISLVYIFVVYGVLSLALFLIKKLINKKSEE